MDWENPIIEHYYGDSTRWFIATVVDNIAPHGYEGRYKIRVHGLHNKSTREVPEADLPWAQVVIPTTEGGASGFGKMPQLLPSSLVFGFFMDGKHSQIPLIVGSIPHVEFPTAVQLGQKTEDVEKQTPENLFDRIFQAIKPKDVDIQNENAGNIQLSVKLSREKTAVRFFLNIGYTQKQAIAMTAGLSQASGMRTGVNAQSQALADFSDDRYTDLLTFSNNYDEFLTQLAFVAYELRGTKNDANIRLLQSDKLEGKNGLCEIFCKYYLMKKGSGFIKQTELASRRLTDRIT